MSKPHPASNEQGEQDGQKPSSDDRPGEGTYGYPNHDSGIQSGNLSDQPGFLPGGRVGRPRDEAAEGTPGAAEKPCPDCGGSGRIDGSVCAMCNGEGTVIAGIGGG